MGKYSLKKNLLGKKKHPTKQTKKKPQTKKKKKKIIQKGGSDDWFKTLFGFEEMSLNKKNREENYKLVQNKFNVNRSNEKNITIQSKDKMDKIYNVGSFTNPTVNELKIQVLDILKTNDKGDPTFECHFLGDIFEHHSSSDNKGALFQGASQFNCLEFRSPTVTPEKGITNYQFDNTQGPACAIPTGPATVYRNYFTPTKCSDGTIQYGQTKNCQINNFDNIQKILLKKFNKQYIDIKNGYLYCKNMEESDLEELNINLDNDETLVNELTNNLKVGFHRNVEVVFRDKYNIIQEQDKFLVSQVYASALSIGYCTTIKGDIWDNMTRIVLNATYEAIIYCGMLNYLETKNKKVYLTQVGGGVFENKPGIISDAIKRAVKIAYNNQYPLEIICGFYNEIDAKQDYSELIDTKWFNDLKVKPATGADATPDADPSKEKFTHVVAFDFDSCLMKDHWWGTHKNNLLDTINPKPKHFAHDNIKDLFRRLLNMAGVKVAIASFGRHDVINKAIVSVVGEDLAKKVYITTPRDFDGYKDGFPVKGFKNPQLKKIMKTYSLTNDNIIFFDDSSKNVKEANKIGVKSYQTAPFTRKHEIYIYHHLDKLDDLPNESLNKTKSDINLAKDFKDDIAKLDATRNAVKLDAGLDAGLSAGAGGLDPSAGLDPGAGGLGAGLGVGLGPGAGLSAGLSAGLDGLGGSLTELESKAKIFSMKIAEKLHKDIIRGNFTSTELTNEEKDKDLYIYVGENKKEYKGSDGTVEEFDAIFGELFIKIDEEDNYKNIVTGKQSELNDINNTTFNFNQLVNDDDRKEKMKEIINTFYETENQIFNDKINNYYAKLDINVPLIITDKEIEKLFNDNKGKLLTIFQKEYPKTTDEDVKTEKEALINLLKFIDLDFTKSKIIIESNTYNDFRQIKLFNYKQLLNLYKDISPTSPTLTSTTTLSTSSTTLAVPSSTLSTPPILPLFIRIEPYYDDGGDDTYFYKTSNTPISSINNSFKKNNYPYNHHELTNNHLEFPNNKYNIGKHKLNTEIIKSKTIKLDYYNSGSFYFTNEDSITLELNKLSDTFNNTHFFIGNRNNTPFTIKSDYNNFQGKDMYHLRFNSNDNTFTTM